MNDNHEDANSYWKDRYFKLLDEDEKRLAERDEYESLLNRAVVRLTLAAAGLDPALDPHLNSIREVIRKQTTSALRQELGALLDTLVKVPKGGGTAPASDATPQRKVKENKSVLGKLFGKGERPAPDERRLRQRLDELLAAINFPDSMRDRPARLRARIVESGEDMVALLDAASDLIVEASTEQGKEQAQLCDFLAALSGKLGELERKTLGMDGLNESSARNRRETERAVAGQVADLRADATSATDLKQLREMISVRLDAIAAQLDSYRDTEEARHSEAQSQVRELGSRLAALEQESEDLRNRLVLANRAAYIDPLTRLPNRNAYLERVDLEEKRWKRFRQPLSLVVWDIDHFKRINDRFGHASGDRALAAIGQLLAGALRNTDFVARYGGEEFVMLLVGADETEALELAGNIRLKIEDCEFTSEGRRIPVTMSCGISQFKGRDLFGDVFERADRALYQAKRKGRNRCELARDP